MSPQPPPKKTNKTKQRSIKLTQFACQAKVNDLDPCTRGVHTDDVLRLEVEVDDVLLVDVLHALQDLLHVAGTGGLRVLKVVIHDAFKELSASDTGQREREHLSGSCNRNEPQLL